MAYANGKIPATALRRSTTGVSLRSDAAASLDRLAAEFEKDMKRPLKATDGYRELRGHEYAQEEIFFDRYQRKYCQYAPGRVDRRVYKGQAFYRKPGTHAAAVPGTSNHGLGIAADLASGINTGFGSEAYLWVAKNAGRHGWSNTEGRGVNEPWHWVHAASKDRYPFRRISVTGDLDLATRYALQRALGRRVTSASTDAGLKALWKSIQKRLNKRGANLVPDGVPGPKTVRALQSDLRRINRLPADRPKVTGKLDTSTIKAWQRSLNARKF